MMTVVYSRASSVTGPISHETCLVPFAPFELQSGVPPQHSCNEGDAEINGHRLFDLSDRQTTVASWEMPSHCSRIVMRK
jgi:hypothetical protein